MCKVYGISGEKLSLWSFALETAVLDKNYPNTQLIKITLFHKFYQTLNCDFQNRVFKIHILKLLCF